MDNDSSKALGPSDEAALAPLGNAIPPQLAAEIEAARSYRARSKAANTVRAYDSDWRQFEEWCWTRDLEPMPAMPEAVATYLASLAQAADAAGTQQGGTVGGIAGNGAASGSRVVAAAGDSPDRIAMGAPDTRAPTASLFNVNRNGGNYLVETDPRLTDHKTWLSSDHLLGQMGYSPDTVQKRLGDGYYEQKLVREQIGQLTGRRFLDGYASDEAQYRALLEAGATVASALDIAAKAAPGAVILAMLPDTGERYFSTPLFADINEGSDDDWLAGLP